MLQRITQALRMDGDVYHRVARDPSLTREALLLVALVGLVTGLGGLLDMDAIEAWGGSIQLVIGSTLAIIVGELLLAGVALLIGRVLFGGTGTYGGVFRATSYAYLPNAMDAFASIPIIGSACYWISGLWYLALCIVAVRESLSISGVRASVIVLGPFALVAVLVLLMTVAAG